MNYYEKLEISSEATLEDIKKSYRRLAFLHHPDRNGGDSSKFLEIQEAYENILKGQPHKNTSSYSGAFSEVFSTMKKEPIKTHTIVLPISIKEALEGVEKKLSIKFDVVCGCSFITRDSCKKCFGVGYIKEEASGIFKFTEISHQNQTFLYKNYYKGISLYIKLQINPYEGFYVKGENLFLDYYLDIFKALRGGVLDLLHPQGEIKVSLPEGKFKDFSYSVFNRGLNKKDLIINFKICLKHNLTDIQKKLLNSIDE